MMKLFKKFNFLRFFSILPAVVSLFVLSLHLYGTIEVDYFTLILIAMLAIPVISEIKVETRDAKFSIKTKDETEILKQIENNSRMFKDFKRDVIRKKLLDKKVEMPKGLLAGTDDVTLDILGQDAYKDDLEEMKKQPIEIQLTKIRFDITDKLNKLAEVNGMGNLNLSIGFLTNEIDKMKTLENNDIIYLKELLAVINKNLKGDRSDESINYIKKIYPTIMKILDKKIQEGENNETSNS